MAWVELGHTLGMASVDDITQLRAIIKDRPPFATGVLPGVHKDAYMLWYRTGAEPRYVRCPSSSSVGTEKVCVQLRGPVGACP
jgi:hypothetical protein